MEFIVVALKWIVGEVLSALPSALVSWMKPTPKRAAQLIALKAGEAPAEVSGMDGARVLAVTIVATNSSNRPSRGRRLRRPIGSGPRPAQARNPNGDALRRAARNRSPLSLSTDRRTRVRVRSRRLPALRPRIGATDSNAPDVQGDQELRATIGAFHAAP